MNIKKFKDFLIRENNENAEQIIKSKLDLVEVKLKEMFNFETEDAKIKKFGEESDSDAQNSVFRNITGATLERSQFSKTSKSLKLIFFVDQFRYDVVFRINLKDAVSPEGQDFDPETLQECEVDFKRYSEEGSEPEGTLPTRKVNIDDINESLFEELLVDLEKAYPSSETSEEEFKIETEEEEESK